MGIYDCAPKCGRRFQAENSASRHRNTCQIWKQHRLDTTSRRQSLHAKRLLRLKQANERTTSECAPTSPGVLFESGVTMHALDQGQVEMSGSGNVDERDAHNLGNPEQPAAAAVLQIMTRHSPPHTHSGRPKRNYRAPSKYPRIICDKLPEPPILLPPVDSSCTLSTGSFRRVTLHVRDTMRTEVNSFGLFREFPYRPSYDPDAIVAIEDLANYYASSTSGLVRTTPKVSPDQRPPWPFKNMSIYRLMQWMNTGTNLKSEGEVNRLVHDVICADDFNPDDLRVFRAQTENKRFDKSEVLPPSDTPFNSDTWVERTIKISIPTGGKNTTGAGVIYSVSGLHHRPLAETIVAALTENISKHFHLTPFKRFWKPLDSVGHTERVYDEIYTSDAFISEYEKIQKQPSEPDCKLEKVVIGLMFWSDSTQVANFGTAKVWPIYLYFANLSKYLRAKSNNGGCHHLAYIPSVCILTMIDVTVPFKISKLPDNIKDAIATSTQNSISRTKDLLTHCRRELMHEVWRLIFDSEFLYAYQHGIVIKFVDGATRRAYPRVFTYSADYPEKVLLAAIRHLGPCPCPRCTVPMNEVINMGWVRDIKARITLARVYVMDTIVRARKYIYEAGKSIRGTDVTRLLKPTSMTPTINAFAEKLGPFGFDPFRMLVVDLMHEFELGVWKGTFTHLIRILYAAVPGGSLVAELDRRFRLVPPFGHSTIRKFLANSSEMKKLAARDFEDLLQCSIPVFDGLLSQPYNGVIMTLLFRLAEWHALAKLRLHTDSTLKYLSTTTATLGREMRHFRDEVCLHFKTKPLPGEAARRRKKDKTTNVVFEKQSAVSNGPNVSGVGEKKFNLSTYKFHALGDYVSAIQTFGTTDSYNTQIGESEHKYIKRLYSKTNKNEAAKQIAKHERRNTRFRRARDTKEELVAHPHLVDPLQESLLSCTTVEMHHYITESKYSPLDLSSLLAMYPDRDPATQGFLTKLKDHLLHRLLGFNYTGDEHEFSDDDRNTIYIVNNRLYSAGLLRVNYTTYDVRRDQDILNPRTNKSDVMVLSHESGLDAHPYWYARIIGIFHADIIHIGSAARNHSIQRMEFLWVRWFGVVPGHRWGSRKGRLPKVGFVPDTERDAFGFLDPSLVLRGCHLIPAFTDGRDAELLRMQGSAGRPPNEIDDWQAFYVNFFADRDMFMRYTGKGVGHCHSNYDNANEELHNQSDSEEVPVNNELDTDMERMDELEVRGSWDGQGAEDDDNDHVDGDEQVGDDSDGGDSLDGNSDSDSDGSDDMEDLDL